MPQTMAFDGVQMCVTCKSECLNWCECIHIYSKYISQHLHVKSDFDGCLVWKISGNWIKARVKEPKKETFFSSILLRGNSAIHQAIMLLSIQGQFIQFIIDVSL